MKYIYIEKINSKKTNLGLYLLSFSGLSFFITFDIDTNYGGKSLNISFPCSAVLAQATMSFLDTNAACVWISRTNLSVSTAGNATIRVGSLVTLRTDTIYGNPSSRTAVNGTLALLPPDHPTTPTLALNAPAQVGSCDDIAISAITQGTLGKPTLNAWSVTATTTNTSDLVSFLGSYTQLTVAIPNALLVSGTTYNFTLTVTNIFNVSATSTITISKSKFTLPTVSIPGSSVIRTTAPLTLTVQGAIDISSNSSCQPNAVLAWGMFIFLLYFIFMDFCILYVLCSSFFTKPRFFFMAYTMANNPMLFFTFLI
jgi:hypothetical protein